MVMEKPGMKSIAVLVSSLALLLFFGHFFRHTFSALLTALLFAYLLNPVLKYLERRGFDRITALILMYGIATFAAFLASFLLIPYLGHQLQSFVHAFPRYVLNLQSTIEQWKKTIAPYYAGEEGDWVATQVEDALGRTAQLISGIGYERFKGVLFGVFDLILAPILIFFILYYKRYFKDVLKRLMPTKERRRLIRLGQRINQTLERFLIAMLIDCLMVGILTAAALYLLDIEFPVLNGLFAGFASIVPFLGATVAVIPAALIGYAKSGDLNIIPKVCLAYFVIHVILEGNLIKPLIMKRTMKLNPLAVIFSLMAMGELLGFWGIVLAVPLAVLVKISAAEILQIMAVRRGNEPADL
jgi:putative permease